MGRNLALIPARGGSKRIPHKNIKPFLGIPIIKYSIDAALEANCFDEVMVSTDNREIADVSLSYGAKVPFSRSNNTADDNAVLVDVIEEIILEYKKIGRDFECFCCILPAAPFISAKQLQDGLHLLNSTRADSVIPVARFGYPIQRALKTESGKLEMIWPENIHTRSQDLAATYHDSGQFYWMQTASLLEQKTLFASSTVPLIIPESQVQDIDTEEDWEYAELKFNILKKMKLTDGKRGTTS